MGNKTRLINSQLTTIKTYRNQLEECEDIALNVLKIDNLPEDNIIDMDFVKWHLLHDGAIAWFKDEVLGLLALPYVSLSGLDLYGNPVKIQVLGKNGYTRNLSRGEFVIMYDNTRKASIWKNICQYAERLAIDSRTIDVNVFQQRTARFWKTSQEKLKSVRDMINEVEGFENTIVTYEDINLDDTTCELVPAPFVADKIQDLKDRTWNEFLRFVGVANITYNKKERQIKDEISAMQGGTIASRFSRYESRLDAISKINKLFGTNLTLSYYDGLPTNLREKEPSENNDEEGDDENATIEQ